MFGIAPWEVIVVLLVLLLLFGNRLPGVMRSMGRSVVEFKKGVGEGETGEIEEQKPEPTKAEKETP
jgi:sec-independent protein translocase protein TatA